MLDLLAGLWLLFGRNYIANLAVAIAVLDILGPDVVILSFSLSFEVKELYFLLVEIFGYFDFGAIQFVVILIKFEEIVAAI